MLDQKEIKLVLTSLSLNRAGLVKSLKDSSLDEPQKELNIKTVKHLDALIKKLASKIPSSKPKPKPTVEADLQTDIVMPTAKPEKREIKMASANILIAEDNPDSMQLLKFILEDLGIKQIDIARDGKEAVTALEKCSPAYDLVILDWDMPEMNGLEVKKSVRSLAKLRDTHYMMVSAVSEASRIKQAIQNGIHDYLVKPVDAEILEKKIKVLFQQDT